MILGTLAVLINLLSLGLLAGVIIFCLLVLASPLVLAVYRRSSPVEQKRLLLLSTTLPWIIAVLVMTAGMVEHLSESSMTSAIEPFIHWHHLDWFQFTSWQGVLLITLGLWLTLSLARYAMSFYKQSVFRKRLESLAIPSQWGDDVYLLETAELIATTMGALRPKIYVSTGLLSCTTQDDISVILAHETSHALNKDNLTRLFLSLACCYMPKKMAHMIQSHYVLATEKIADQYATTVSDGTGVATTLVKVAKLRMMNLTGVGAYFWDQNELNQRVHQLLSPTPNSLLRSVPSLLCVLIGSVLSISLIDVLHHFFDSFI